MVNPIKFITRATGLSNIIDKPETPAPAPSVSTPAPAPSPAPLVGQEPTPTKPQRKMRQFAPSIVGSAGAMQDSNVGGKTLLGQ